MNIDRRQLPCPHSRSDSLSVVPAFAGADEDAVAKNVEAFRVAQAAGNAEGLASLCADDLSYSHSNAKVDTKASLLDGTAKANYKWTALEYKDPTIRVVGPTAIVRFTFVGEQEFNDGKKTPQNLHILMNWQKQAGGLEVAVAGSHQALTAGDRAGGQAASVMPSASRFAARSASRACEILPSSRLNGRDAAKN